MKNKKVVFLLLLAVAIVIFGNALRLDRFGLEKNIDWTDCIQFNQKLYVCEERTPFDASLVGDEIGKVTYHVSAHVHNSYYSFRNGDAALLEKGTKLYGIPSDPKSIAAEIDGVYYIYTQK